MRRFFRKVGICLTAVWLLTGTIACDSSSTSTDDRSAGSKGVIGVSLMTLTNPFFKVIADTITEEGAKHGYSVECLGADEDAVKQTNQVKNFIVQQASAIVIAPYDSRAIGPAIAEANAAGIPVFTVDNGVLDETVEIVAHVATDNYPGGKQAGEAMIEALGEAGGKVGILEHPVTQSCLDRVRGFKEVIDAHNTTAENRIEIVAQLPCGGNRQQGHRSTQDILQAHPDLAGIFAINDPGALGAYAALQDAGKENQVKIIGFDGQPEGKRAIRDGKIYADPIQFPDRMAVKTVELIMQHFDGEEVEREYLIPTELYRQSDGQRDESLTD